MVAEGGGLLDLGNTLDSNLPKTDSRTQIECQDSEISAFFCVACEQTTTLKRDSLPPGVSESVTIFFCVLCKILIFAEMCEEN